MQRLFFIVPVFFLLLQSCTSTRRFGTTIERDPNNPCQINIVIQVAVQGTEDDVKTVRSALEECYNRQCFIPCPGDSTKGCMTKTTVVVKSYGELKEEEREAFHYVNMIDDDGLPSYAYIGTPNSGASSGTWRRGQLPAVYCHEVLHFCGLKDKYCARLFDPVTGQTVTERNCDPPPDPAGGNCCHPTAQDTRCTVPCAGHEHDLMGTSMAVLSCENIMDVLKGAGLDNCPAECCGSNQTFSRPPEEFYLSPGYLHFGDKNTKFGTLGVSVGGMKYVGRSFGISLDGGYYQKTEKQDDFKQNNGLLNLTGGVGYRLADPFKTQEKFQLQLHLRAGVSYWKQKTTFGNSIFSADEISPHVNLGAALHMRLHPAWMLRLLQVEYAPTFFYDAMQQNVRVGIGIVYLNR